jgi:hypothetical protein
MKKVLFTLVCFFVVSIGSAQNGIKVLFDARKAQMAGNADWVIDADVYNIGTGTGGVMQTGRGNEANPQRIPTPLQSGISSTTPETFWKGALSSWAIALVKRGYTVETLPFNASITYGNASNVQDLSNYKVYICVEPNIRFTAAEKTAILQFVQNGGGLFMVGNHNGSDRNSDGWDAPKIWNDLMSSNGISTNPFGITFDLVNFSQTTSAKANLPTNSILNGPAGIPQQMKFSAGTSMTLNKTVNPNALGLVFKTGSSTTGTSNVMFAQSRYGIGKVAAIGDSSPPDDGTGDTNDQLYNGWSGEVNGDHSKILINATIWLSNSAPREGSQLEKKEEPLIWPNPFENSIHIVMGHGSKAEATISLFDISGQKVPTSVIRSSTPGESHTLNTGDLPSGIYIVHINDGQYHWSKRLVRL